MGEAQEAGLQLAERKCALAADTVEAHARIKALEHILKDREDGFRSKMKQAARSFSLQI